MIVVSTTGYIIRVDPFFSDYSNNDGSIMKNILIKNREKILNWLHKVRYFHFFSKSRVFLSG